MLLIPCGSIGVPAGTAHAGAAARFARKPPSGCVRWTVRRLPFAVTFRTSEKKNAIGDFMRGFLIRSIVSFIDSAVTGAFDGGEKRKPRRILNVQVVPPFLGAGRDSAISGTT